MTEDVQSPFAQRVQRIRSRRQDKQGSDRWMLVLGGTLLPLGLAFVALGWAGVSRTVYLYDQLTYLASGTAVGLALVIVGGFVYFTYWQTVQVREGRIRHEESQEVLLRIEALLSQSVPAVPGLVVTAKGTLVHRSDCVAVRGRPDVRPAPVGIELAACRLCDPLSQAG